MSVCLHVCVHIRVHVCVQIYVSVSMRQVHAVGYKDNQYGQRT
jgi:hypothetical protein